MKGTYVEGFGMVITMGIKRSKAGYLHHAASPKNNALTKKYFFVRCSDTIDNLCPSTNNHIAVVAKAHIIMSGITVLEITIKTMGRDNHIANDFCG